MVAGEQGKLGIIRRAKQSPTSVVIRYKDARRALVGALLNQSRSGIIVENAIDTLDQRASDASQSVHARDDAEKSVDALRSFSALSNRMVGLDYRDPGQSQPCLRLGGVQVSVNLDLLTVASVRGQEVVGGVIFSMNKPDEEETETAQGRRREIGSYAATLIRMQIGANHAGNREVHGPLCWSVDVQCGDIHEAPRQYRRRQNDLEAACQMIAAMWPRL